MKKFLTTAPVFAAIWFTVTAGILIEFNRFYPDSSSTRCDRQTPQKRPPSGAFLLETDRDFSPDPSTAPTAAEPRSNRR